MERLYLFVNLLCFGVSIKLSSIQVQSENVDGAFDLCETENFEPKCGPDEVVIMKSAKYGRMELGKCVKTDYGYVGCYVNVLAQIDKECSGRRTCKVRVPNTQLKAAIESTRTDEGGCGGELNNYLSVSYKCLKVESDACHDCASSLVSKAAKVTSQRGYIGGIVTQEGHNKCGTARCPWSIEVLPGQNINVSIFDFGGQKDYSFPSPCFRYGSIKEKSTSKATPLCAEDQRYRHVYTSVSHSIQLQVVSPEALANKGQFVVYYEAVGCPDHMVDDNMWRRRMGNKLEISCQEDFSQKWEMTCVDNEWKGPNHHCPSHPITPPDQEVMTLPLVVLIAIVVAIALVVGVLILTIGVVFLKRQHSTRMNGSCYYRTRHDYDYPMGAVGQPPETYVAPKISGDPTEPSKYQPVMHQRAVVHPQNWYKRTMETRPLPSLPNIAEASGGSASTVSRSDDDPQLMHAAEVHRADSDRERRYLTNPRSSASRLQPHQQHVVGNPPVPPQVLGVLASGSSSGVVGGNPPSGSGNPPGGGNRKLGLRDGPKYFVLDDDAKAADAAAAAARRTARAANARATAAIVEQQEDPEKSPEEENEENDSKEFSRNNSWHEITLRPTRVSAANVNNTSTENTTGKTSWP